MVLIAWVRAQRDLVTALAYVLESRFIHDCRTDDLGVTNLNGLFGAVRVESDGRKRKLPNSFIVLVVPHVLITDCQCVTGSHLEVEARADVEHSRRTGDGLVEGNDLVAGIQHLGDNDRYVVNVSLLDGEEIRRLLAQRTTDVPIEDFRVIARLLCDERIERVES